MLARLPRDGFQRNSPEKISMWGPRYGVPHPSFASFAKEGGDFDSHPGSKLLADTEFRNDRLISLGIVFLQVVEQATPLADQHEQAAA
jgi:hypothetical protein